MAELVQCPLKEQAACCYLLLCRREDCPIFFYDLLCLVIECNIYNQEHLFPF